MIDYVEEPTCEFGLNFWNIAPDKYKKWFLKTVVHITDWINIRKELLDQFWKWMIQLSSIKNFYNKKRRQKKTDLPLQIIEA